MDANELIRRLKSIRAWIPESFSIPINKINELIQMLGGRP
jgi:hypothetical protein